LLLTCGDGPCWGDGGLGGVLVLSGSKWERGIAGEHIAVELWGNYGGEGGGVETGLELEAVQRCCC